MTAPVYTHTAREQVDQLVNRAVAWGGDQPAIRSAYARLGEDSRELLAYERFTQLVANRQGP